MTAADRPDERPAPGNGATTASKGTAAEVDVSTSRRAATTFAIFLAGPILWSVHFMVVYLAVEAGCTGDGPGLDRLDPPVPTSVTLWATAVGAIACLATAAWGYRRWRAARREHARDPGIDRTDQGGSLLFAGFLLSLLGFVSILFVGLPALVLPACLP